MLNTAYNFAMTFQTRIDKLRIKSVEISEQMCTHNQTHLAELFQASRSILENESFREELNMRLHFLNPNGDESTDFYNLMLQNAIQYLNIYTPENDDAFKIIELISASKMSLFLNLNASTLISILDLVNDQFRLRLNTTRILNVVSNLSQLNLSGSIDLSSNSDCLFKRLADFPSNSITQSIEANLHERPIPTRLAEFGLIAVDATLWENDSFLADLRFVSLIMNSPQRELFRSDFFVEQNSCAFFSKLLKFILNRLKESEHVLWDLDEKLFYLLRDLLKLISKLVYPPLTYEANFRGEGLLQSLVDFLGSQKCVEFLFKNYINLLYTLIHILVDLSRDFHFNATNGQEYLAKKADSFCILRDTRDLLVRLSGQADLSLIHQKPVLHFYLKSLAYLQEAFSLRGEYKLFELEHCKLMLTSSLIPRHFTQVTDRFLRTKSEHTFAPFINEYRRVELRKLTVMLFYFENIRKTMTYSVMRTFPYIAVMFACKETKRLAYPSYKHFFKSVVYYALDIEKIQCLACLREFCLVEEIRQDIFDDEQFIEYVKDLASKATIDVDDEDNEIACRLVKMANRFLTS